MTNAGKSFYDQFLSLFDNEDRYGCVKLVSGWLSENEIDIVTLYENILAPSLREEFCKEKDKKVCIWEEHIRTSIVRTVVESCYTNVVKERDEKYKSPVRGKVITACPTEEFHEIGARMVADFFTLCGFDSVFVGANTPQNEVLDAIARLRPAYVAVSVSNHYNLIAARRMVQAISEVRDNTRAALRIIIGGYAFEHNPDTAERIGADFLLSTFDDIHRLSQSL